MMEVLEQKLKFNYENSASASYLAVLTDDSIKIKKFQIEMIANNTIKGILPVDIRNKNNDMFLYYDITSKQALTQFLSRKKLTKAEFAGIISDIVSILLKSGTYLLSEKCFLLHEDYIYINPLTMEIYLIYLPFDTDGDQLQNIREFVIKMIVQLAIIDEKESDNFLQRILTSVRQENFNLNGFYELLSEIKGTKPVSTETQVMAEKESVLKQEKEKPKEPKSTETVKNPSGNSRPEIKLQIPGRAALPLDFSGGKQKQAQTKGTEDNKNSKDIATIKKSNTVLIAALLQSLVIIGVILVAGYLKQVTHDTISAYGGTAIILFAVDFMLLKKLFEKDNLTPKGKEIPADMGKPIKPAEHGRKLDMGKREIRNEPLKDVNIENAFTMREPSKEGIQDLFDDLPADSFAHPKAIADETALLDIGMLKYPHLQRHFNGMLESISISKPNFIIGRLRDQVDYVLDNSSVGKIHAEIVSRDGEYFLVDLNTKNGTYINGIRIPSNKEYEIHSNDRITFANAEHVFLLSVNR